MQLLPAFAIHRITTSHPDDIDGTGPEYAGRVLCFAWFGWMIEVTIARKTRT